MSIFAAFLLGALIALIGDVAGKVELDTVNDLRGTIQPSLSDRACLLLGSRDGTAGCFGNINSKLAALSPSSSLTHLPDSVIGVVEEQDLGYVVNQTLTDPAWQSMVKGIVVLPYLPGAGVNAMASPASKQPLQAYYLDYSEHVWNPAGLDILAAKLPYPLVLARNEDRTDLLRRAEKNAREGYEGTLHFGHLQSPMLMNDTANSTECLAASKCVPLGGHTVWAAMPPLPADGSRSSLPHVLVLSHWDSQGLFKSDTQGAVSSYSGLITMLVAADILSTAKAAALYTRHLVFVALAGEAFDLMASRRLLWDIGAATNSTKGLALDKVEGVLEVGMLGQRGADDGAAPPLFYHQRPDAGNASELAAALRAAAGDQAPQQVTAATGTPGLPPSSLLAMLRAPFAQPPDALYLADFNAAFSSPNFYSHNDNVTDLSADAIAAAAAVVARTLHKVALSDNTALLPVDDKAAVTLAQQLMDCLLTEGGLSCPLVKYMTATTLDTAEQYVGDLSQLLEDDQDSQLVKDVERFTWEFLANRTFEGAPHTAVDSKGKAVGCDADTVTFNKRVKCADGEVCLHTHPNTKRSTGMCVRATVKYAPSYSTMVNFTFCGTNNSGSCKDMFGYWRALDDDAADAWAAKLGLPLDSMWTETINTPPETSWAMQETARTDGLMLFGGLAATLVAAAGSLLAKAAYAKHLKDR